MFKKSLLSLLILSSFSFANEKNPPKNVEVEIQSKVQAELLVIQTQQQHLLQQRENFLALESLLQGENSQQLSASTLTIADKLLATLEGYPLEMEAQWALLKAKLDRKQATETEIQTFLTRYPDSRYQKRLVALGFEPLYQQQKYAEVLTYAKQHSPDNKLNQCRVFSSQYQLLAQQTATAESSATAMQDLLAQFEKFWLDTAEMPDICADIEAFWQSQGGKSVAQLRQKAVQLVIQNALNTLEALSQQSSEQAEKAWFEAVQNVARDPQHWQAFAENQPFDSASRSLVLALFPKWLKTQSEDISAPDFDRLQPLIAKWQLTSEEVQGWKSAFISRFFDNDNAAFQTWRDTTLAELKNDSLTERRVRMAIGQQVAVDTWLRVLSPQAQHKAEWRYWLAKTEKDPQQQALLWGELAKERGFYAMLSAQMLGKPYDVSFPKAIELTAEQQAKFAPQLARIAELRQLNRLEQAQITWAAWLKDLPYDAQLGLAVYAKTQQWFDLAVEATIQAKAWDYLDLRLPLAYSTWFQFALTDKAIRPSFAMAIARQESAWRLNVRSSANAIGLMQLLPSTAKLTAEKQGLPYEDEKTLLNPFNNILLGTAHLNELNEKYPNNRALIAAAYNAGANRVEKWLARSQGKLAFDEFVASIPFFETRGYVQNVLTYDYYYQWLQGSAEKVMFTQEEVGRKY